MLPTLAPAVQIDDRDLVGRARQRVVEEEAEIAPPIFGVCLFHSGLEFTRGRGRAYTKRGRNVAQPPDTLAPDPSLD